jgi:predicted membrane GTPase involved in stress response
MAVIPPAQTQVLYSQAGTDLVALFAIRDMQTGDTIDLTTTGIAPPFTFVRFAIVMSFSSNKASLASAAGTVVTMPSGLPANSSAYLLIGGC